MRIYTPWDDELKKKPARKKKAKKKPARKKAKKKPARKKKAKKKAARKKKAKKKAARKKKAKKAKKKAVRKKKAKKAKKAKKKPARKKKAKKKTKKTTRKRPSAKKGTPVVKKFERGSYTLTHVPTGFSAHESGNKGALKAIAKKIDRMKGVAWGSKRVIEAAMSEPPPKWFREGLFGRVQELIWEVTNLRANPRTTRGVKIDWGGRGSGDGWVTEQIQIQGPLYPEGAVVEAAEVLYPNRCWAVHKTPATEKRGR
jgi:hypothetical protein